MDVKAIADGGAIVCGSTGSFGPGGGDIYVVRAEEDGNLAWSIVLGTSQVDVGKAVLALPNGYLVVGSSFNAITAYDGYVAMLDLQGELLWEQRYGTSGWDFLNAAVQADDGFFLAGQSYGGGEGAGDAWVVKIGMDGTMLWQAFSAQVHEDEACGVVALQDGGCVVTGTTRKGQPDQTALMARLTSDGTLLWFVPVGLGPGSIEDGHSIVSSAANDLVLCGSSISGAGTSRMFMGRVNLDGEVGLVRTVTSEGDDWGANDLIEVSPDSIVMVGYTKEYGAGEQDVSMLFLNAVGDFLSGPTYGGTGNDVAYGIDRAPDGGYFIAGVTSSYGPGPEAMLLIRSDGDTLNGAVFQGFDPVHIDEHDTQGRKLILYPNPVNVGHHMNHTLGPLRGAVLYSIDGRTIATLVTTERTIALPTVVGGPYIVHIETPSGVSHRTLVRIEE